MYIKEQKTIFNTNLVQEIKKNLIRYRDAHNASGIWLFAFTPATKGEKNHDSEKE